MIGETISHYYVLKKLGRRGVAIVYRAEDTAPGRFITLEFLPEEFSDALRNWNAFRRNRALLWEQKRTSPGADPAAN